MIVPLPVVADVTCNPPAKSLRLMAPLVVSTSSVTALISIFPRLPTPVTAVRCMVAAVRSAAVSLPDSSIAPDELMVMVPSASVALPMTTLPPFSVVSRTLRIVPPADAAVTVRFPPPKASSVMSPSDVLADVTIRPPARSLRLICAFTPVAVASAVSVFASTSITPVVPIPAAPVRLSELAVMSIPASLGAISLIVPPVAVVIVTASPAAEMVSSITLPLVIVVIVTFPSPLAPVPAEIKVAVRLPPRTSREMLPLTVVTLVATNPPAVSSKSINPVPLTLADVSVVALISSVPVVPMPVPAASVSVLLTRSAVASERTSPLSRICPEAVTVMSSPAAVTLPTRIVPASAVSEMFPTPPPDDAVIVVTVMSPPSASTVMFPEAVVAVVSVRKPVPAVPVSNMSPEVVT